MYVNNFSRSQLRDACNATFSALGLNAPSDEAEAQPFSFADWSTAQHQNLRGRLQQAAEALPPLNVQTAIDLSKTAASVIRTTVEEKCPAASNLTKQVVRQVKACLPGSQTERHSRFDSTQLEDDWQECDTSAESDGSLINLTAEERKTYVSEWKVESEGEVGKEDFSRRKAERHRTSIGPSQGRFSNLVNDSDEEYIKKWNLRPLDNSTSARLDSSDESQVWLDCVEETTKSNMSPPSQPKAPDTTKSTVSAAKPSKKPVHYTLIVRLPFPRGDFVDPSPVYWDAAKDRKLWKLISRSGAKGTTPGEAQITSGSETGGSGGGSEIDWPARAAEFGVDTKFLVTQAAWLYERHLEAVKKQVGRLRTGSTTGTPNAGQTSVLGKKPSSSRAPSALSTRSRDSPVPKIDTSMANASPRPGGLSRTPSNTTVTQSRQLSLGTPTSPRLRNARPASIRKKPSGLAMARSPDGADDDSPGPASESSSSASSDDEPQMSKSHAAFRRLPRFGAKRQAALARLGHEGDDENEDEEESSDDEPTFLSFAVDGTAQDPNKDLGATLRTNDSRAQGKQPVSQPTGEPSRTPTTATTSAFRAQQSTRPQSSQLPSRSATQAQQAPIESSTSSLSSAANTSNTPNRPHHPLSPRHRANLARLSSPRRGAGETSDGTPSMGSSFSDLDDASLTQSALEEAYASNIQAGGSRLSNISHAFRSRLGQ